MPLVVVLLVTAGLVAAAIAVPLATGWDVHARADSHIALAPWHGWWDPHLGPGTVPAAVLAVAAIVWSTSLAARLPWRRLLAVTYLASLAWLLSLALVDGTDGLSRVLGNPHEYLRTARDVEGVGSLLATFTDRIPADAAHQWPTHVAGHPPGMLLFFVALVRVGLGGDLAAGLVVTVIAASIAPAVMIALRRVAAEDVARRVAPFLAITPAAVYLAVSADAVMAAVGAWAMALLAHAVSTSGRWSLIFSASAGLLFGALLLMSYGLALFAMVALGLVVASRAWRVIAPCGAAAALVVVAPALAGFWWPEALGVLRTRYWDGIASDRPGGYWMWANLALLTATAGPAVAAGLMRVRSLPRAVVGIILGAIAAVVTADLSQMSRAEVERIWLPFVPWLTVALAALPARWHRVTLSSQVVVAIALQHLMYTTW